MLARAMYKSSPKAKTKNVLNRPSERLTMLPPQENVVFLYITQFKTDGSSQLPEGEERCTARCNYELQTNKEKMTEAKRQFLPWKLSLLSPAYSEQNGVISETLSALCRKGFFLFFFNPIAHSPLLGYKYHNSMPPGPGEGSRDSYWVSHFNQFILEISMPSNEVQLGWGLWFAQKLLERNLFLLAEVPAVYSSWHVTDILWR